MGEGGLARALAERGYEVVGVDPGAPPDSEFRRIKLEELDDEAPFHAVVMVWTLHHVGDLDVALDKVVELLLPGGLLILDDFGWELLDEPTAEWFHGQQRAGAAAHGHPPPESLDACKREWREEHLGLHGYAAMRAALDARFRERSFSWEPYLHAVLEDAVAAESLERTLIDADAITPMGFRYVGEL